MLKWAIFAGLAVALFLAFEVWSIRTKTPTLSRTIWTLTGRWSTLAALLFGAVAGYAACHLFGSGRECWSELMPHQ